MSRRKDTGLPSDIPGRTPAPERPAARPMRLARYLAMCGTAARRKAEDIIREGRVTVDGRRVTDPACTVTPGENKVELDGVPVLPAPPTTILLYKPRGVTCSMHDPHAQTVLPDILPRRLGRLVPVGRLDRDSEGALLCTTDGDLAHMVAHPRFQIEKVYHVHVRGPVDESRLKMLENGIRDAGELLRATSARILTRSPRKGAAVLEIVLKTGRKREIRRMCARAGWKVDRLIRVRIGPVELGALKPGRWRFLTDQELHALRNSLTRRSRPPDPREPRGPSSPPAD